MENIIQCMCIPLFPFVHLQTQTLNRVLKLCTKHSNTQWNANPFKHVFNIVKNNDDDEDNNAHDGDDQWKSTLLMDSWAKHCNPFKQSFKIEMKYW